MHRPRSKAAAPVALHERVRSVVWRAVRAASGCRRLDAAVGELEAASRGSDHAIRGQIASRTRRLITARPEPDVLSANASYAQAFNRTGLDGRAARGLAVLTCIDSRIDPLAMLGLKAGDAKILRNAGARVTDDVLTTLVIATYLLGVQRVMVVAHTGCRMAAGNTGELHEEISAAGGPDTRSIAFATSDDQEATLRADVQRVRSSPYLPGVAVGGFLYDVDTGRLREVG